MPQDTRIILKIEHPLRWYQRPKVDQSLLIMANLAIVFNWILAINNAPPILGLALAILLFTILKTRKNVFSKSYTQQLGSRILLSTLTVVALGIYTHLNPENLLIENSSIFFIFGIILALLSIYDTANCMQGRLGLRIIAPLLEAIRTRKS